MPSLTRRGPRQIPRITLTYANYVLALRADVVSSYAASPNAWPPHACLTCGEWNATGVVVLRRGREECPTCVPHERRCAHCERQRPVIEFDVTGGQRVESYCGACRRILQNRYYHTVQRAQRKVPPGEATCRKCGFTLRSDNFNPDQRYKYGIYNICRMCHNC